jgi:hypothetical protein
MRAAAPALLVAALLAAGLAPSAAADITRRVSCFGAFLTVDPFDNAQPPTVLALSELGLAPGNVIRIDPQGDFDNGPGGDEYKGLFGVFSSSNALLLWNQPQRVPGAIGTDVAHVSGRTCPNLVVTDIPEDFYIPDSGRTVTVPAGAQYLFLQANECYFADNSDPDDDFAVRFTLLTTDTPGQGEAGLALAAPLPNPARGHTVLAFTLPREGGARLSLHGVDGRRVREWDVVVLPAGAHRVVWDNRDATGVAVPAGLYFARLEHAGRVVQQRVSVVR